MQGEQTVVGSELTKAVSIGGRPIAFRVRPLHGRDAPALEVSLFTDEPLPAPQRRAALDRVRAVLGLDDDLDAFYALAARDEAFALLTERYRGLRHVRFPSPFEAACWGVINQRVAQQVARRWKEGLTRRAGGCVRVDGEEHWCFPEPAAVARLDDEELARLVPGGRRAKALAALARAFGDVGDRFLAEAPVDAVRAWLRAIHGVGPFTSGLVLFRGLGRFDGAGLVAPRLVAAARTLYGRPLDEGAVARLAQGYGPWGGYWMLYLWASTFVPPRPYSEIRSRKVRPPASARPESSR
jgi:DNA-3-methyladenine glycosylase II